MSNLVPYVDNTITTRAGDARIQAEKLVDRFSCLEHLCHLVPLGQRLRQHHDLLAQHDLYIAIENDPSRRFPGLYILKRDHSRWCHVWVCGGGFRLDSGDWNYSYGSYGDTNWHYSTDRDVDLSLDLDIAERAIVTRLERNQLRLGTRYLPNNLTTDLDNVLPHVTANRPSALPAPVELKAIEVKPVALEAKAVAVSIRPGTPATLRPVALAPKPLQRR